MADKHILPRFAEAASILFRGKTWNRIAGLIEGFKPLAGNGIRLECTPTGTLIHALAGDAGAGAGTVCPFGGIVTWTDGTLKTGIAGGIVIAGTDTWNFDPYEINLTTDGEWLVYFSTSVEVNRDDDGEILLPGVKEGNSKPSWAITASADYPDGTAPVVSTGNGTIILPIGKLTVNSGVATFTPTGCGGFVIGHCAGTLFFSRS